MYCITIDRYALGWPGDKGDAPAVPVVSLQDAFTTRYSDWRHIVPAFIADDTGTPAYAAQPRLLTSAPEALEKMGLHVRMSALIADVDGTGHRASNEWRDEMVRAFSTLPPHGWYASRNGFRIVMVPDRTFTLAEWSAARDGFWTLLRNAGIKPDTDCASWNWLFALPMIYRQDIREHLDLPQDWSRLGPVNLDWIKSLAPAAKAGGVRGLVGGAAEMHEGARIPDGQRTAALMRAAGKLRASGLPVEAIEAALLKLNEACCSPPVPDAKVIGIARSVGRYEPREAIMELGDARSDVRLTPRAEQRASLDSDLAAAVSVSVAQRRDPASTACMQRGSDVELADIVIGSLRHDAAALSENGMIWRYASKRGLWERVEDRTLTKAMAALDGERIFKGLDKNGDPQVRPLVLSHTKSIDVYKQVVATIESPDAFENTIVGAPFRNGVLTVDVQHGLRLIPHHPSHRLRWQMPFDVVDMTTEPTIWMEGLQRVFANTPNAESQIQLLREWIGLNLLGLATSPVCNKAILMLGSGENGKSHLIIIVSALHPPGTVVSVTTQAISKDYSAATLDGATLNAVAEADTTELVKADKFKAAITGDPVEARHPYGRPFMLRNKAGFLIAANQLIPVSEHTRAFWRRWCALEFNVDFSKPGSGGDDQWKDKVLANELPAVAVWALQGALDALRRGRLHECPTSAALIMRWRKDTDQVATFLADATDPAPATPQEGTALMVVYDVYRRWAERCGHKVIGLRHFSERLGQAGVQVSARIRAHGNTCFVGARLLRHGL